MGKIKLFANSVCDLPPDMAEEYGIGLIPDLVVADGKVYRSNIDLTPAQLYEMLPNIKGQPTSSHPNVTYYLDAFRSVDDDVDEIICINLSSKVSGSVNTSSIARDMLAEEGFKPKIYIYDTLQTSFGQGIMVLEAARMVRRGCTVEQILAKLDEMRPHMGVYFLLRSLESAKKGGRVSTVRVLAADLLGVKPVLTFRDGIVRDVAIVRKFVPGMERIAKYYDDTAQKGKDVYVFHAANREDAETLRSFIAAVDPDANIRIEWVGPAIGIHTGIGCVGVAFEEKI